jgi:hypothetical protein
MLGFLKRGRILITQATANTKRAADLLRVADE